MRMLFSALAGGLFGAGLYVSGMTDTTKVIGWLDLFGDWDPTLAFVLGGAIIPMFFAWRLTEARAPMLGGQFPPRPGPLLDRNLVVGSALFGLGWGLSGLCPGPAMASLSYGGFAGFVFFAAMAAGMFVAPTLKSGLNMKPGAA